MIYICIWDSAIKLLSPIKRVDDNKVFSQVFMFTFIYSHLEQWDFWTISYGILTSQELFYDQRKVQWGII